MATTRPRSARVPNANNPRLLLRLIGLVAAGLRRERVLAEVLEVELRTVHYYTQAGEWLGLLDTDGEVHLTRLGLDLAYASPQQRWRVYAEAAWRNPFAAALLTGRGELPETPVIASYIQEQDPTLAPATARRRASAVRSLLEPAVGHRPRKGQATGEQLRLPLAPTAPVTGSTPGSSAVDLRAGTDESPDVYARVLRALLDHGELSTGQLRAVLDQMGADRAPLATYADMATRRGDAVREDDVLICTGAAQARRELSEDGVLVALSDPTYRRWLALVDGASPSAQTARDQADERQERKRLGARFRSWDQRIFGTPLQTGQLSNALARILPGRQLTGLPLATGIGQGPPTGDDPFVDMLDTPGLGVAFPRALVLIGGGVTAVNALLKRARSGPAGVRLPGPADARRRVHGTLLHPSESLPRAVPDNHSLRLRALSNAPAISLLGALLVLARRPELPLSLNLRGNPGVRWRRRKTRDLIDTLAAFCRDSGWTPLRPISGGLDSASLVEIAEALNLATRAHDRLLLAEATFVQLQEEPEARLVYESLMPLVERMHAWLEDGGGA